MTGPGWHPRAMACPNCQPDGSCSTCHGSGLHPNSHVINDGLFTDDGQCVATVEVFHDGGPHYANAITPIGEWWRKPFGDGAAAVAWAERVAGVRPLRADDLAHAGRLA